MNAIEIRGLEKRFPRFHLGPVQMTVPRGSIYGFIGPNGAGKTTTLDLLLGMGRSDGGQITVLGKDHQRDAVEVKRQIGYVSPDLNFQVWGRVSRAVQFVRGFYPDWDANYCEELMRRLRISPEDKIGTLSFGAKIKLALILALSHRPRLLILDEPTVGLDAVSKSEVFSELLKLVEDGERTVVISSHGLSDIERFADHIGIIKDGQLVLEGSTDEVVGRYRMVDFAAEGKEAVGALPGMVVIKQEGSRCRALVDTSQWVGELGARRGLRELSAAPVTLEELFVSLARG